MRNIHQILLSTLLEEKNVAIRRELFQNNFHIIFPDYDSFSAFLQADSTERRVQYAKEISEVIFFDLFHSPTSALFNALLDTEINDSVKRDESFIPQDHIVHSVNVYLLGVYLFFNHPLFHKRLWEEFSYSLRDNRDLSVLDNFICAWKMFAFCHDLGYGFERLILKKWKNEKSWKIKDENAERILEAYYYLDEEIRYDRLMKATAILLFVTAIVERSKERDKREKRAFTVSEISLLDNCLKKSKFNKSKEKNVNFLENFTKLVYVYSDSDLQELYPYITPRDVISITRDDSDKILFIDQYGNRLYSSDSHYGGKSTTSYFCYHLDNVVSAAMNANTVAKYYTQEHWSDLADVFCEPSLSLSINDGGGCHRTVFSVYKKLKEIYSFADFKERSGYDEWRKRTNTNVDRLLPTIKLTDSLLQEFRVVLNECDSKLNYQKQFQYIKMNISRILEDEDTLDNLLDEISPIENRKMEDLSFLYLLFHDASEVSPKSYPKLFRYAGKGKKRCVFTPLSYQAKQYKSFADAFKPHEESLKDFLTELKIISADGLEMFLKYEPRFSPFDHGISSAHILICAAVCEELFGEECHKMIEKLIEKQKIEHPGSEDSFNEAVGAIAVHNIYVDTYKRCGGKDFLLTFDCHPLAYFGAFCDTLQLWDRHHSIDQSRAVITDFNPSGEHFSLEIQGERIVITCEYANEKKAGHYQRQNLRQFLQGADTLLKVNFIESNTDFF